MADPASATTILSVANPSGDHYGGQLKFGPDGYLYIAIGDGSVDGVVVNTASDLTSLLGKIIRIDVDGGAPYAIPVDNPFVSDPQALDEIWALGLRNPWRFSFDRLSGELLIADIGEDTLEEINIQTFDSTGGEDYGWSRMGGTQCFESGPCDPTGLSLPIAEYGHAEGCAVTGGYVYRGQLHETLHGVYFFGDFCSGQIRGLLFDGEQWRSEVLRETPYEFITFGEDEAGNLYVADYASGQIFLAKQSDLAIDDLNLLNGIINRSYFTTLGASGGQAPYSWSVIAGVFPAGLTLNATTGVISGTPLALGTSVFTVEVSDAELNSVSREYQLTVTPPPPIIQTTSLPRGSLGEIYTETIEFVDGTPPLVWSVSSGALPSGLTLDSNSGVISGIPSAVGQFSFDITVTDSSQQSDTASYVVDVIDDVHLTVGVLETGQYGHQYGGSNHLEELIATFTSTGESLVLDVDGYDIDYGNEVLVSLNGWRWITSVRGRVTS